MHIVRSTSLKYSKIRQFQEHFQFDVCRHEVRYGCLREDSCHFAHSFIELKVWLLQQYSGGRRQGQALAHGGWLPGGRWRGTSVQRREPRFPKHHKGSAESQGAARLRGSCVSPSPGTARGAGKGRRSRDPAPLAIWVVVRGHPPSLSLHLLICEMVIIPASQLGLKLFTPFHSLTHLTESLSTYSVSGLSRTSEVLALRAGLCTRGQGRQCKQCVFHLVQDTHFSPLQGF